MANILTAIFMYVFIRNAGIRKIPERDRALTSMVCDKHRLAEDPHKVYKMIRYIYQLIQAMFVDEELRWDLGHGRGLLHPAASQ